MRLLASALLLLVAILVPTLPAAADDDFYRPPEELPASNGAIVRSRPTTFYLDPARTTPVRADAHRVMYRSTDAHGEPMAVTGTVLTPDRPWQGTGERPVVGYAVGTQGLGDQCAPSRQLAAGTEYEGGFLQGLLERGYGVVVPDYQGLGTPGVHTYVVREAQAHAVLDGVRAAQRLEAADLPDAGPIAISGYSQGGGASAAAAELQSAYAPELDVRGAYAGAVPADLAAVATFLDGGPYAGFLLYAVNGLTAAYPELDTLDLLNARGDAAFHETQEQCVDETVGDYALTRSETLTESGRPLADFLDTEPYRSVVAEQRIGQRAPQVPVLVVHSALDDVVPYHQGRQMARSWCEHGTRVRFDTLLAPTHAGAFVGAFPVAFQWLEQRFSGAPAPTNCGWF